MSTTTTITRHPLARRGAAYTSLIKEMDRRGETALHDHARAQLIDCADALLFDEADASRKLGVARQLLEGLAESGRWESSSTDSLFEILEQIGSEV